MWGSFSSILGVGGSCEATKGYGFSFNGTSYMNATLDSSYKECIMKAGPFYNTDSYVFNGTSTLNGWTATET